MTVSALHVDSRWPHRWAVAVACATFPLIFVGGLVTSYDAGMAVPDWPNTFGYNLFLYPWETWFFGPWDLFIEHGHRLLGALTGMLAIFLVVSAWRAGAPRLVRSLAVVALFAICLQGLLGGMRVYFNEVQLAKIHGCFGPAFFGLSVAIAAMTSRGWRDASPVAFEGASRLRRAAVITATLAFLQIVIGAHLRHTSANMSSSAFGAALFMHLVVAAALLSHVATLFWRMRTAARRVGRRSASATLLAVLVIVQIALGASTWLVKYGWPAWFADTSWSGWYVIEERSLLQATIATAHVATGSLILATAVLIALWTFRYIRSPASAGALLSAALLSTEALSSHMTALAPGGAR